MVEFLRSHQNTLQANALRIDWRAVLHSYTLKMSEDGELALRLAIRKLNAGQSRVKTLRPWLGTIVRAPAEDQPGLVEPVCGTGAPERRTVMRHTIPFKPAQECQWPQTTAWEAGTDVLCWSRSGEQRASVMLAKPVAGRERWAWPALAVTG